MKCYYASTSELILTTLSQLLYVRRIVSSVIFQEPFIQYVICFWESLGCKVTGPRRYSHDLAQGSMEIPCTIEFKGDEKNVNKLKWVMVQQKENRKACVSHLRTKIKEEKSDSTTSTVGVALKESQHASVQVKVKNPRCASVNISIQKSAHAAVKVQSAASVAGPSMVQANVSESPHTLVNVKLMDFQGNETKIIDVDEDEDKSNAESQSISTSSLSTIAC